MEKPNKNSKKKNHFIYVYTWKNPGYDDVAIQTGDAQPKRKVEL